MEQKQTLWLMLIHFDLEVYHNLDVSLGSPYVILGGPMYPSFAYESTLSRPFQDLLKIL